MMAAALVNVFRQAGHVLNKLEINLYFCPCPQQKYLAKIDYLLLLKSFLIAFLPILRFKSTFIS